MFLLLLLQLEPTQKGLDRAAKNWLSILYSFVIAQGCKIRT